MSLADLAKIAGIDWTNTAIEPDNGKSSFCGFDISPQEFLEFAEQDFRQKNRRGLANGLANAKRAIDSEIDKFFGAFGYNLNNEIPPNVKDYVERQSKLKEKLDLPLKLKLISLLEISRPNLVSRVRHLRNLLEHDYRLPTEHDVYDAIELASLFVPAVDNVLNSFWEYFCIGRRDEMMKNRCAKNGLEFFQHYDQYTIQARVNGEIADSIIITNTQDQFLELLRLNIAISVKRNYVRALYELLQAINCNIPEDKINVELW